MQKRGTRGAYRKEDRVALPQELQKELVEKAAAKYGNCQELAKHLNLPKSSVHYYRIGRLTMPVSVLEQILEIADDAGLRERISKRGIEKDRTWANEYAVSIYREMCRDRLRLPTRQELAADDDLRRKAAAIVSYVMAEGSVWLQKEKWGECAVNITFAAHETDLYDHFRFLCREVFLYDIGPPQEPGNGAIAIRGFIYSRFVAEWLIGNGVLPGDKSDRDLHLPKWIIESEDPATWISALQPWCDGEGHVIKGATGVPQGFSMLQARHTDLDYEEVSSMLTCKDHRRTIAAGHLRGHVVHGIPVLQYCGALYRSEILMDVAKLFRKLGFHPRTEVARLFLKNDGLWSCHWSLKIPSHEVTRMATMGIIIQDQKRAAASVRK